MITTAPHISTLRAELLATLADLRCRNNPMEPDRAKAIAQVAGVVVDSARAEVEFLRLTGQDSSEFFDCDHAIGISHPKPGVVRHKIGL